MPSECTLVHYLYTRLRQLGIDSVHGVPGDYNLVSLDYLEPAGLKWVGDANELNAGYAADGYARVKGIGAVMTTFGVGELSAINAIAGSYAERVSVVHIAGSPSTHSQEAKQLLHHTLGDGDFDVFSDIYRNVTVCHATLNDIPTATSQLDLALRECWIQSRPVYIELPTNMVTVNVDATTLETPLDLSSPKNDPEEEQAALGLIFSTVRKASKPVLLVDGLVDRYRLTDVVIDIVRQCNLPVFVTPMGKGLIDETLPNFCGLYGGLGGSNDSVREYVESSDMVLHFGPLKSDFNTSGFSYKTSRANTIEIHRDVTLVGYSQFNIHIDGILREMQAKLGLGKLKPVPNLHSSVHDHPINGNVEYPEGTITQNYLWSQLSSWLRPNDILLTETGTSYLGVWDTLLPKSVQLISQTLWGSIGYTLPAAQGAALAAQDKGHKGRVILLEGDGSMQLTAQAIGTMIKEKLDIIILLINNDGYTIERWVHGMKASYNDIPRWKYAMVPEAMGGEEGTVKTYVVKTTEELEKLWGSENFLTPKGMHFVEMMMPKEDAPTSLKIVCAAAAKTNTS